MTSRTLIVLPAAAAIVTGGVAPCGALGAFFSIQDLGSLSGWTVPAALAESGEVIGSTVASDWHSRGFLWSGSFAVLPHFPPLSESQGMDLNSEDDFVQAAYTLGAVHAAALRTSAGSSVELGAFVPTSMTSFGAVAGTQELPGAFGVLVPHAVVWNAGVLTVLPQLPGGEGASASDLTDDFRIVGSAFPAEALAPRATLWSPAGVFDLGTLGGGSSHAEAIAGAGYVCGHSATTTAPMHAFRFRLEGTSVVERLDLGTLGGGWSVAYDVNDHGWVVGTSDDRAFVWIDGAMWDLNLGIDSDLGWSLIGATGINNSGEIVGWGELGALGLRAFRLILFPSPCAGDVNGDGATNAADFTILAGHFGVASGATRVQGDLNGDGAVNVEDFTVLAGDFGCGS